MNRACSPQGKAPAEATALIGQGACAWDLVWPPRRPLARSAMNNGRPLPNQKFTFTSTGGGYYRITPTHATGSCLDVNGASTADGANVQLWQWLNGNNQQWYLQAP